MLYLLLEFSLKKNNVLCDVSLCEKCYANVRYFLPVAKISK